MSTLNIQISLRGKKDLDQVMQARRNKLARRRPLHASMAADTQVFTQGYLRNLNRHRTARALGATPTYFHANSAKLVEAQSDDAEARLVIPRSTGLGRAFSDVVLKPRSGKTYLTIPAHKITYGRGVRDWPEGAFKFALFQSVRPCAAFIFAEGEFKGTVAYWLKTEVTQKQDRTLLPDDKIYREVARRAAIDFLITNENGGEGTLA